MNKIHWISLCVSHDDEQVHRVGRNGVTAITENKRIGEYCDIKYYDVWKGDKLFSEMHRWDEIRYLEDNNEDEKK